jgi:hypothetical protein
MCCRCVHYVEIWYEIILINDILSKCQYVSVTRQADISYETGAGMICFITNQLFHFLFSNVSQHTHVRFPKFVYVYLFEILRTNT